LIIFGIHFENLDMTIKHISLILLFVLSAMTLGLAQDQFDRAYRVPQERSMFGLSIIEYENGGYAALATIDTIDPGAVDVTGANFTTFNPKGNIGFSKDYIFEDTISIFSRGNMVQNEDEGFLFTAMSLEDLTYNNFLVKINRTGNIIWSHKYGTGIQNDNVNFGKIDVLNLPDTLSCFTGVANTTDGSELFYGGIDENTGNYIWNKSMSPQDDNTNVLISAADQSRSMLFSVDSTVIMTGGVQSGQFVYILKTDILSGEILWSKKYFPEFDQNFAIAATDIVEAQDSSLFITGRIVSEIPNRNGPFLMKIDSLGNLLWTKFYNYENISINADASSLEITENGNIIMMITATVPGELYPIMSVVDQNGLFVSQFEYRDSVFQNNNIGELVSTQDGGSIAVTTGIDHVEGFYYTRLIKMDNTGAAKCMSPLDADVSQDMIFTNDTLLWNETIIGEKDTLMIETLNFTGYTAPTLPPADTMYCMKDPIMYLADKTTQGAVSYKWFVADSPDNIISTDSAIIITEPDIMFVVEVEIEEDLCYSLCDTSMVTQFELPTVDLGLVLGRYCEERLIGLQANPSAQAGLTSLVWEPAIAEPNETIAFFTELGTYRVTIMDNCEEVATASITINESDLPQPANPTITLNDTNLCETGIASLNVFAGGVNLSNVMWSTGETANRIDITESGNYSVTATDECNFEVTASIDATLNANDTECIEFPNAFIPSSNVEENTTFGPFNQCGTIIDYNLRVYNKWGKLMFESNDIQSEWTGEDGGNEQPGDVYVYYASFSTCNQGEPVEMKGEVTLLR